MKSFKSTLLTVTLAVAVIGVKPSVASTLSEDLFRTPIIQEQVTKLEQAGWSVGEVEVINLHSSWMGMGRNSRIVLLNVAVDGGRRYMQTKNIVAIFSAGSMESFTFKNFLDPWSLAHSETR